PDAFFVHADLSHVVPVRTPSGLRSARRRTVKVVFGPASCTLTVPCTSKVPGPTTSCRRDFDALGSLAGDRDKLARVPWSADAPTAKAAAARTPRVYRRLRVYIEGGRPKDAVSNRVFLSHCRPSKWRRLRATHGLWVDQSVRNVGALSRHQQARLPAPLAPL